jgi:hypothetical protein
VAKESTAVIMAVKFQELTSQQGLKQLNDYLLTRSYITGYVRLLSSLSSGIIFCFFDCLRFVCELFCVSTWQSPCNRKQKLLTAFGEGLELLPNPVKELDDCLMFPLLCECGSRHGGRRQLLHLTEEEVKEEVIYVRALFVYVHCRYQASRDDLSVFAALRQPVPAEFVNLSRWHSHIAALVGTSFSGAAVGVHIESGATCAATTSQDLAPSPALESAAATPEAPAEVC